MERHQERVEHQELLFAIVSENIASFAGKTLKQGVSVTAADFMPSQRGKKQKKRDPRVEAVASLRGFFGARQEAAAKRNRRMTGEQLA